MAVGFIIKLPDRELNQGCYKNSKKIRVCPKLKVSRQTLISTQFLFVLTNP